MSELVSVIIPVYNVKPYLTRCLASIVGQTYKNLEILVIDDGSTDGSSEICDRFAAEDVRIRVFKTENCGLSAARNLGLEHAKGTSIVFVDSDDYAEPEMIQRLHEAIASTENETDFAVCGYDVEGKGRLLDTHVPDRDAVFTVKQCLELFTASDGKGIGTMVWNKLFKAEVFEKIHFPEGHTYEDIWVFPEIMDRCRTVHVLPQVLYHHQMNPESITHRKTYETFLDSFLSRTALIRYIKKNFPELSEKADQYMLKTCITHWYKLFLTNLDDKTRRHLQEKLRAKTEKLYRLCGAKKTPLFQRTAADLMLYCPYAAKYLYSGLCLWNRCRGF